MRAPLAPFVELLEVGAGLAQDRAVEVAADLEAVDADLDHANEPAVGGVLQVAQARLHDRRLSGCRLRVPLDLKMPLVGRAPEPVRRIENLHDLPVRQ
eukprot:9568728-Alexandrium_andersonii.AAC.1